jgi:hypothetical protein
MAHKACHHIVIDLIDAKAKNGHLRAISEPYAG